MKKIIAIILTLVMVLTLTACDSSDYKKAMGLYEEGDYVSARAMFVELADYENSPEMVKECDYGIALNNMEQGNYKEAAEQFEALGDHGNSAEKAVECRYLLAVQNYDEGNLLGALELFKILGDYRDSAAYAKKIPWQIIYNHMGEGNNSIKSLGNSQYAIIMAKDEQVYVGWSMQMSGLINAETTIAALVDMDGNVVLAGSDKLSTHAARYEATAKCDWDRAAYKNGDTLEWDEFEVSGYSAQGGAYPKDSTMLYIFLNTAVKNLTAYLESYITENNLGITMYDLGFTNYN